MIRLSPALACVAVLGLATAGCSSGHGPSPAASAVPAVSARPVIEHVANNRFTVTFSSAALQTAQRAGLNLTAVVGRALDHINALLPGPATTVAVGLGQPGTVLPQTGTDGFTNATGTVMVWFRATGQVSLSQAVQSALPRDLSHEADHSVRILAGPGFGTTLLAEIITEGISSVFEEAAFPGAPNPWDRAISPGQECTLWNRAKPVLGNTGLYDLWMFGSPGVIPHWTGFTIGYDIVKDYRNRHPQVSWSALTATSAATILAGSGYQPCAALRGLIQAYRAASRWEPGGADSSQASRPVRAGSARARSTPLSVSPSWHSATMRPGPRIVTSSSVGGRRATTVRSRRGKACSGRMEKPKMRYQKNSSSW
jgi:Predicted Zn-dependent protease (DUF2268)